MDLRQKVIFASERAKVGLEYNPELIQTQFLQTLVSGLQDKAICTNIKPYLQDPSVPDEVLLENERCLQSGTATEKHTLYCLQTKRSEWPWFKWRKLKLNSLVT